MLQQGVAAAGDECTVALPWAGNNTRDTADVLHGVLKQHKVHHSIGLVVLVQSLQSTAIMSSDVLDFTGVKMFATALKMFATAKTQSS